MDLRDLFKAREKDSLKNYMEKNLNLKENHWKQEKEKKTSTPPSSFDICYKKIQFK